MNKPTSNVRKDTAKLTDKIDAEVAAQNKTSTIYLAEQSDGMRLMFIRWHKEEIKILESIKSLRE